MVTGIVVQNMIDEIHGHGVALRDIKHKAPSTNILKAEAKAALLALEQKISRCLIELETSTP